ncbi:hypothetical protein RB614_09075 [Phytohabitans sp. ZYX-F-186]|uniref:Uncharacterized protein n=1 Tax=Phytohabitans maris TaxID=3071409 RepID=A0ABU0ZE18_9ACTN|nr:hypothetical protein [Phytohabitans sp. ZYX-F-186]MDQ7904671.1 hypothetical protein [Phytohabitans sp. ZYX-F-186]
MGKDSGKQAGDNPIAKKHTEWSQHRAQQTAHKDAEKVIEQTRDKK